MNKVLIGLACILTLCVSVCNSSASVESQALVDEGRVLLFNHGDYRYSGFLAAKAKFEQAVSSDTDDQEAHLFLSVTKLLAFGIEEGGESEPETLRDMADLVGITYNDTIDRLSDGLPYNEMPDIYGRPYLPGSTPDGDTVQNFISGPFMSLVNDLLNHLNLIESDFITILTIEETGSDTILEIDYGDILLIKSCLTALKTYFYIVSAYDLNVDIRELVFIGFHDDTFQFQRDILARYPEFLKLKGINGTDGKASLANAKSSMLAAFDYYRNALTEITNETDYQGDDCIFFESQEELDGALLVQTYFDEAEASLDENRSSVFTSTEEFWHFTNGSGDSLDVSLEFDMNGVWVDGDVESNNNFLLSWGEVESYSVSGSTVTILLNSWVYPCGYIDYTLTGTLDGDQITNGTFSYTDCDSQNILINCTGARTDTETESVTVDLNCLFGNSGVVPPAKPELDIRSTLPEFDLYGEILPGTFPGDPVLNGIIPDLTTNEDLTRELELQPSGFFNIPVIADGGILVDGSDADWPGNALAFADINNDEDEEADFEGTDIKDLFLAKDSTYLYIGLHLYDGNPNASYTMMYMMQLISDWDEPDEIGKRYARVIFDGSVWKPGVYEQTWDYFSPNVIGEYSDSFAAAGTQFIEWKVLLADIGEIPGKFIRALSFYPESIPPLHPVSDDNSTRIKMETATATVNVNFSQTPYPGGTIYIGAYTGPSPNTQTYGGSWLTAPGSFEMPGLPIGQTVYFFALRDADDNGVKSVGDYSGVGVANPIIPAGVNVTVDMTYLIDEFYPLTKPGLFRVFGSNIFDPWLYQDIPDNPNEISWGINWTHLVDANETTAMNSDQFYKYILMMWPRDLGFRYDAFEDLTAGTAFAMDENGFPASDESIMSSGFDYPIHFKGVADGVGALTDDDYGFIVFSMPDDTINNATPRDLKVSIAKETGDLGGDNSVSLEDAILGLKIISGIDCPGFVFDADDDMNNDGKISLAEVIYILEKISGSRTESFVVNIPDGNLENAIRDYINKDSGDILNTDLHYLFYLWAGYNDIQNLEGLQYCPYLTTLSLSNNNISDISQVSDLKYLESLDLSDNQITDISSLAGLRNLKNLNISGNQITDISSVANLTNLESLYIYGNAIGDLSNLTALIKLKNLAAQSCEISDVSFISNLTNLETLNLYGNQISNINPLSAATSLKSLNLGMNQITNFSIINDLVNLEYLTLRYNQLTTTYSLSNLSNLNELDLSHNQINNIGGLTPPVSLETLRLWDNQITNIDSLLSLTNLTYLTVGRNQLTNISGIGALTGLETLELSQNQITDISSLLSLTNLRSLYLYSNLISDISSLVDNSGIDDGDYIGLDNNPLNNTSCSVYIPQLESRGVNVNHSCE